MSLLVNLNDAAYGRVGVNAMNNGTERLRETIEAHGWAVVKIDADAQEPAYAYSVGLYKTFQHPEVIVFGLDLDVLHRMVNTIGEQVKQGQGFEVSDADDRVIEGYRCAFRQVAAAAEPAYMGILIAYYGHNVPALHCIWPDREGRFPWEVGTSLDFRQRQPMLSDGPEPFTHVISD
jgi:hypothetical protein